MSEDEGKKIELSKRVYSFIRDLRVLSQVPQLLAGQFKINFYFWFLGPNVNFYAWNDAQASKKGFFNDKKSLNDLI